MVKRQVAPGLMEQDSALSGSSKFSRSNTDQERREYQKRRRERQKLKKKGKNLQQSKNTKTLCPPFREGSSVPERKSNTA